MFTKSANRLTNSLIDSGIIQKSDFELYNYGFEMSFAIAANILTTLVIGILFSMFLESLIFLTAFIPLRSYIGGFHASNYFRCYWISTLAIIAVLFAVSFILVIYNTPVIILIGGICALIMFLLMPVQDANRPLDNIEISVYRKKARSILCLEVLGLTVLSAFELRTATSVLLCTMLLVCATACAGAVKNLIKPIN